MSCSSPAFSIIKGDSFTITILIRTKQQGVVYNLTGCTLYFDAKIPNSGTYVLQKSYTTHLDPVNGFTQISLSTVITDALIANQQYEFGIKIKNPAVSIDGYPQEFSLQLESNYFLVTSKFTQE